MMMIRVGITLAVVAACEGGKTPKLDAGIDPRKIVVEVPATPNRDLDILFVVDDSSSMADKQANLVANFPNFINVLATGPGGLPNLHLGVITTDMGTKGSADASPGPAIGQLGQGGCAGLGKGGALQVSGAPVTGTFISDIALTDGSRQKNYTGDLSSVFGMMARVGAGGCGFEQPLASVRAALANNPANAGFLRPSALLAVIFLTDEDDCSISHSTMLGPETAALGPQQSFRCTRFGVTCDTGGTTTDAMNQVGTKSACHANTGSQFVDDVAPFHDFLLGLKADARQVIVAGIMGTTDPFAVELRTQPGTGTTSPALAHSCTFNGAAGPEVADPPVRLQAFLDLFPDRSTTSSICQQDLSGALGQVGQLVATTVGSPCIGVVLADSDSTKPGVQPDCIVEDVVGATATLIKECDANNTPTCWRLDTDAVNCTSLDHLKLVVVRSGAPDPATVTRMRCVVE